MVTMDKKIGSASVRVSKKITRIVNHHLKSYQITTEQWVVLRTLKDSDRISQKELSIKTDKDQATLTKILDLLEKRETVRRVPNPSDRRSYLIEITQKGEDLVQILTPYIGNIFMNIVSGIEPEKLAAFQEVLGTIENNIEQLLAESKEPNILKEG